MYHIPMQNIIPLLQLPTHELVALGVSEKCLKLDVNEITIKKSFKSVFLGTIIVSRLK